MCMEKNSCFDHSSLVLSLVVTNVPRLYYESRLSLEDRKRYDIYDAWGIAVLIYMESWTEKDKIFKKKKGRKYLRDQCNIIFIGIHSCTTLSQNCTANFLYKKLDFSLPLDFD